MNQHQATPRRWTVAWATALAVLATPFATYFAIGDLSEAGTAPDPDYMVHPPSWSATTVTTIGVIALAMLGVAVLVLVREHRRAPLPGPTIAIGALLLGAGLIVAGGYRVMTAATIGANIGAGIAVLFGVPLLLGFLGVAGALAWRQRASSRR